MFMKVWEEVEMYVLKCDSRLCVCVCVSATSTLLLLERMEDNHQ